MNQQNVNDEEPSSTINANNYEDDDNSDYGSHEEEEDNEEIRQMLKIPVWNRYLRGWCVQLEPTF